MSTIDQNVKTCSVKLAAKLDEVNPSSKEAAELLQSLMVLNSK